MLDSLKNVKNYETINNINNLRTKKINKEIDLFLNENVYNEIKLLINKYNIEVETIIYNNNSNTNETKIKIFGEEFVKNNKNFCYLDINNELYDLQEYVKVKDKKKLKINLIGKNKITNLSYLFHKCNSLLNFGDILKYNTCNITNISHLLDDCSSLIYLPDISKWNTSNVTDMSYLFSNCNKITNIPDISLWNTKNVKNLSYMFYNCSSLNSIPNISGWYISNVTDMNHIFSGCSLLTQLPDISKWDIDKVIDISYLFYNCKSVINIPDISNWNVYNIQNMSHLFDGCSKISSVPDISNWKTNNILNINFIFNNCRNLLYIPDIYHWKTEEIKDMNNIFDNCALLLFPQDISKWKTDNNNKINYLIYWTKSFIILDKYCKKNLDINKIKKNYKKMLNNIILTENDYNKIISIINDNDIYDEIKVLIYQKMKKYKKVIELYLNSESKIENKKDNLFEYINNLLKEEENNKQLIFVYLLSLGEKSVEDLYNITINFADKDKIDIIEKLSENPYIQIEYTKHIVNQIINLRKDDYYKYNDQFVNIIIKIYVELLYIHKKDEILPFLESNYSYISSANNEIILICEKYNLIDALIFLSQK